MRIRPYIADRDFEYLEKWIDNERIHALWCANRIPYPITKDTLQRILEKNAVEWTDSAYVATEDNGTVVGFFCYSVNLENNIGFLKFVIVDSMKRGQGYGSEMLRLALQYAFVITKADAVQLNVFSENPAAMRCYESVGFVPQTTDKDAFSFNNEMWSRCNMIVRHL